MTTEFNSNQLPVPAYFCVDEGPVFQGYHVPSKRWNGWATPMFELSVAKQIATHACTEDFRVIWEEDEKRFVVNSADHYEGEPPEEYRQITVNVDGKDMDLYALGSGSWCWDDYERLEDTPSYYLSPRG